MIAGAVVCTGLAVSLGCRLLFGAVRVAVARALVYVALSVVLGVAVGARTAGQMFDGDWFEPAALKGMIVGGWLGSILVTTVTATGPRRDRVTTGSP